MLGQKTCLNTFKRLKSYQEFFSDHNGTKQEINYRKKTRKITNMWILNNMLLNNNWIKEGIKGEF